MERKALINYTKEAFGLPINLTYLSIATFGTITVGFLDFMGISPLPWESVLFGAAGIEMIYLGLMQRSPSFIHRVNANYAKDIEEVNRQSQAIGYLKSLQPDSQERYIHLNQKKNKIAELLSKREGTSAYFLDRQLKKLDRLEMNYLQVLLEVERYEEHLQGDVQERLNQQLAKVHAELSQNLSTKVRKYYEKRRELINKRKEKFSNVEEHLQLARIQLDTIDDTVNYLIDQTLALNNADELSAMIDQVIEEAEAHHESAQELEDMFSGDEDVIEAEEAQFEDSSNASFKTRN